MEKLKLELDALAVESFDTGRADAGGGTVRGHEAVRTPLCSAIDACPTRLCDTRLC
jgi:hypothetical protein